MRVPLWCHICLDPWYDDLSTPYACARQRCVSDPSHISVAPLNTYTFLKLASHRKVRWAGDCMGSILGDPLDHTVEWRTCAGPTERTLGNRSTALSVPQSSGRLSSGAVGVVMGVIILCIYSYKPGDVQHTAEHCTIIRRHRRSLLGVHLQHAAHTGYCRTWY